MEQITMVGTVETAPKHRRGGRLAWLIGGAAVTASLAAAVAFAVVPAGTTAGHSTGQVAGSQSYDSLSAQQILLAAAEVAQKKPATTGKYWHTKVQSVLTGEPGSGVGTQTENEESWVTHSGQKYDYYPDAKGVLEEQTRDGLKFGDASTLDDIANLPTEPAALIAWINTSIEHLYATPPKNLSGSRTSDGGAPAPPASARRGMLPAMLVHLLYSVPASPEVRATALRALASLPSVTKLGPKDGGEALRIPAGGPGDLTVVINPTTATLISYIFDNGTTKVLAAEWTDTMPNIGKLPTKK
jgi:hypothetical protein